MKLLWFWTKETFRVAATAALVSCLLLLPAVAQENYGSISGTVTDATGASVPAATVSATGPALPRGIATETDASGNFLLPRVPNGTYTLTVSKDGFSKYVQRNVEVRLGSALVFNVPLKVGAVAEVIEVSASAIQLDTTSSASSTNITASQFDNLPKGRNFHTLLAMAPGVRMETKAGNAGVGGFQVDGASGSENAFLVDGVDTSDVRRGSLRLQNSVPFEFLSEVQIKSAGFGAEYGGATGGVINVTTRGGNNQFHGQGMFNFTTDGMNPRPRGFWKRSAASADVAQFVAARKDDYKYLWPGFTFGGPIIKDILFFNVGYMPQFERRVRTINYAAGAKTFPRDDTNHYGLARVDFNPHQKLQTYSSWVWSPWKQRGSLQDPDPLIAPPSNDLSVTGGFQPAQAVTAGANYSISSRWLVSGRYGYKYQNDKLGNYGIPGAPYVNYLTASASQTSPAVPAEFAGANGFRNVSSTLATQKNITTRHNVYLDSSYIANFGSQQHIFKFGYSIARLNNDEDTDYTNGFFRVFWGEAFSRGSVQNQRGTYGYYVWEDGVRNFGQATSRNQGFYIQDEWRPRKGLTINLGVRFENEFLPPFKKEVNGIKIANPVSFDWGDKIAPRIGVAWSPDANGKWKLAGSFGIYYDLLKYELARGSFGLDYWWSNVFRLDNPNVFALGKANAGAGGPLIIKYDNRTIPINAQGELEGIDPGIKPYTSREFSFLLSHELRSNMVFTARYARKDLLTAIEDIGVLDADDSEVYLIGNPGSGQTRDTKSVYGQKTTNGQEFLVPKAVRQYDSVEFRLDGRFRTNLQANVSYTWSRLYGNYSGSANTDESGRSDPGVSRAFDLPYYYFDASGSQKNILGLLGTDRPHTFKAFISYDVKSKIGRTNFGLNQIAWSGTPDSTTIIYLSAPTFPNGRGDMGRTPTLTQTDLAVSHDFPIKERARIRFEANFFNLLNQATVISRVTQINRASAIPDSRLPVSKFFAGYNPRDFLTPFNTTAGSIPYNPIYGFPSGDYRNGGPGAGLTYSDWRAGGANFGNQAYQAPREIRLGVRFIF